MSSCVSLNKERYEEYGHGKSTMRGTGGEKVRHLMVGDSESFFRQQKLSTAPVETPGHKMAWGFLFRQMPDFDFRDGTLTLSTY